MNGTNYKLSVIIPTYNGAEWIESGIRSIATQMLDLPEIEFLIRDNASTDNMKELVSLLQKEFPGIIKYDRRVENTPELDINFKEAIDLINGEYILLVGDDDVLLPYSLRYILDLIEKYPQIALFYVNRIVTNYEFKNAYIKEFGKICPEDVEIYSGVTEFLKKHINGPDFVSVNIIKRESYCKSENLKVNRYYGYEWYAKYLFGIQESQIMSISLPLVIQRLPKVRSWGKKSVLYALLGLSNLLEDIDKSKEVYNVWMKYIHQRYRIFVTLSGLTKNRSLYKEKYIEIRIHLNCRERLIAILLLYCPLFKYIHSSILMTLKKIKLL